MWYLLRWCYEFLKLYDFFKNIVILYIVSYDEKCIERYNLFFRIFQEKSVKNVLKLFRFLSGLEIVWRVLKCEITWRKIFSLVYFRRSIIFDIFRFINVSFNIKELFVILSN